MTLPSLSSILPSLITLVSFSGSGKYYTYVTNEIVSSADDIHTLYIGWILLLTAAVKGDSVEFSWTLTGASGATFSCSLNGGTSFACELCFL